MNTPYKLTASLSPEISQALSKKDLWFSAVKNYGSPLNVIFPNSFSDNLRLFQSVLEKHDVLHTIFFAHKPNKSPVFAQVAAENSIGMDVASLNELSSAQEAGISRQLIEATGPKTPEFLVKCLEQGITINVDAEYELDTIIKYAHKNNIQVPVLIRLSGFQSKSRTIASKLDRFGINIAQIHSLLDKRNILNLIDLKGFSFHINNDSLNERIIAIEQCLDLLIQYREQGFTCNTLDIGGGFPINLMEDKSQFDNFINKLKLYTKGEGDILSLNGSRYGYFFDGQAIKGDYTFQPPYRTDSKERFLDSILSFNLPLMENRTVGQILSELEIELWMEPGQSLLDQCGITIMRVIGIKKQSNERIIFVEGNYSNLDSDRYELFTDPILISNRKMDTSTENNYGYFISGNLCLSIDIIMNHKVYLPEVKAGDLLVFANTAPYRMDFIESTPLQNPVAQKVVYKNNEIKKNNS